MTKPKTRFATFSLKPQRGHTVDYLVQWEASRKKWVHYAFRVRNVKDKNKHWDYFTDSSPVVYPANSLSARHARCNWKILTKNEALIELL